MSVSPLEKRTVKDHAILTVAAGAGLTIGEFCAEFAARATKYEQWQRFAVKAAVKIALAAGCFALARQITQERSKKSLEIAAYADLGMIIPDFIYAAVPGGLWGLVSSMTAGRSRAAPSMANSFGFGGRRFAGVASQLRPSIGGRSSSSRIGQASIRIVPRLSSGSGTVSSGSGTVF